MDVIKENNMVPCVKVLSCDSTNVNTGWEHGVNTRMEDEFGHRLVWHICMLHTNELPLRHLLIDLDGPTTGHGSFIGPIDRLCKSAESLPKASFVPITTGKGIHELPSGVVKDHRIKSTSIRL